MSQVLTDVDRDTGGQVVAVRQPAATDLTPQAELAVLARALYREGYDDHHAGHITYRQPDGTLLTLPIGIGWNEATASDAVRIDESGRQLDGPGEPPPALLLHIEYHRLQPGVNVTIHQHPRYTTIWSAAGRVPPPYDQLSATLRDQDLRFYDDYTGPVEGQAAARHAAEGIGDATCTILRNHGCFVVGDTIEHAFSNAVALEWRCRQAWMAEAIGATNLVPDHGRREIEQVMERLGWTTPYLWDWAVRRELGPPPPVTA
jgi:L-fuculose-phosphate aldolase